MVDYGVVHGRFQIVHNDHVTYIMAARKHCRNLIVGITNADPTHIKSELADPNRSRPEANPLSYFERYCMLRAVLLEQGLKPNEFEIVPFPINNPALCRYYIPKTATLFITIYDEWGEEKNNRLKAFGYNTEVLWQKPLDAKGITSTKVRRCIIEGSDFQQLVPPAVYRLVLEWEIGARLRQLARQDRDIKYN